MNFHPLNSLRGSENIHSERRHGVNYIHPENLLRGSPRSEIDSLGVNYIHSGVKYIHSGAVKCIHSGTVKIIRSESTGPSESWGRELVDRGPLSEAHE